MLLHKMLPDCVCVILLGNTQNAYKVNMIATTIVAITVRIKQQQQEAGRRTCELNY